MGVNDIGSVGRFVSEVGPGRRLDEGTFGKGEDYPLGSFQEIHLLLKGGDPLTHMFR